MKNYKIDLFDEKKLKKEYEKYKNEDIYEVSVNDKIYFYHYSFFSENNILKVSKSIFYENDFIYSRENEIIMEDWTFVSESMFFTGKIWNTDISPSEKYKDYKIFSIDNKIKYFEKFIRYNGYFEEGDECSEEDSENEKQIKEMFNIYLDSEAEILYNFFKKNWFEILWFNIEKWENLEIDLYEIYKINFIVKKPNKLSFKKYIINDIENHILENEEKYTIERLKEKLKEKILSLNKEYWKNGKDIPLENDKKYKLFKEVLLLLEIDLEIKINIDIGEKYKITLLKDKTIEVKTYKYDEMNNILIINDFDYEIKFKGFQAILMKDLAKWEIMLDKYKNNWNAEESLKKISREKIKNLKNFKIRIRKIKNSSFKLSKKAYIEII